MSCGMAKLDWDSNNTNAEFAVSIKMYEVQRNLEVEATLYR